MRWLRGVGLALWSVAAIAALPAAACERPLDPPEQFVQFLMDGDPWGAYDALSDSYRDEHTFQEFLLAVSAAGLDHASFQVWCTRSIADLDAIVDGHVTVDRRRGAMMEVHLARREDGAWVIDDFTADSVGEGRRGINPIFLAFPSRADAAQLVADAIDQIGTAAATGDFTEFRSDMATLFRDRFPDDRLREMLDPMVEQQVDLQIFTLVPPIFEPTPRLLAGRILVMSGLVPIEPRPLLFRFLYVREQGEWRLIWLALGQTSIPDAPEEFENLGDAI